jgi:Domain of unknown function (DUF6249)
MGGWADSPFSVPVAAFLAVFGIVWVKTRARYAVRKLQSQERLAAIEKGQPLPPEPGGDEDLFGKPQKVKNPGRRIAALRTGGIVCLALGVGLFLFFVMLAHVLEVREVLSGAAVGLIPMAIGAGLLLDVRIQTASLKAQEQQAAAATRAQGNPPAGYLE